MTIAENLTKVRENIARAAKDAGLDERDILLALACGPCLS